MPGPASPFGYDETFHNILAEIIENRPEQIRVRSAQAPTRLRALFNQFRASWEKESEKFRKRKDLERSNQYLQYYYELQRYSCQVCEDGILLTNKNKFNDEIVATGTITGPVTTPFPTSRDYKAVGVSGTESLKQEYWKDIARKQEETVMKHFGKNSEAKPEQVMQDNPPTASPSAPPSKHEYAFFLANGKPPASREQLELWLKTGAID